MNAFLRLLLSVLLAMWICVFADAQITLETAATTNLRTLVSLEAGVKLLGATTPDTLIIYNLDLSVYRYLVLPPPPNNYNWQTPWYVTQALFDTDTSNVEYMVQANGPNATRVYIYREDGTLVFSKIPGSYMALGDGYDLNNGPPIIQTTTGAKLLLQDSYGDPTEIYALPGALPCPVYCDGSLITSGGEQIAPPTGTQLLLFPNPANEGTEVVYELPQGTSAGELVFYDTRGQQVMSLPVDSSIDRVHVSTSMLAAGTYLYQLRTGTEVIGGPRLVVVH
ncbi:MAG: T9SS type A sorting domain-containing protein [Flavobacteriales bacterium]